MYTSVASCTDTGLPASIFFPSWFRLTRLKEYLNCFPNPWIWEFFNKFLPHEILCFKWRLNQKSVNDTALPPSAILMCWIKLVSWELGTSVGILGQQVIHLFCVPQLWWKLNLKNGNPLVTWQSTNEYSFLLFLFWAMSILFHNLCWRCPRLGRCYSCKEVLDTEN